MRYEEMRGDMNRYVGYKKYSTAFKSIQVRGDKRRYSGKEIRGISRVVRNCKEIPGGPRRNNKCQEMDEPGLNGLGPVQRRQPLLDPRKR